MKPLRILVVDDSLEYQKTATAFLAQDPRVRVVGCALDGRDGVRLSHELAPDLVLMDLAMPVMNGLAATREIKSAAGAPRVVIVSVNLDNEYRRSAAEAGADGFICKSDFAGEVPELVEKIFSGRDGYGRDSEDVMKAAANPAFQSKGPSC